MPNPTQDRRLRGETTLPNSCLRVLLVILDNAQRSKPSTVRGISAAVGWKSAIGGFVQSRLKRLKTAGLIEWEPGEVATIRPTCRVEVLQREGE